ncbi:MAG TPA: hypothetical protein VMD05_07750 [Candidatus Nanoarchaeia archaeon]|nr:hypothetical protein [Candidatus Nanoarchaeia archaeon]
MEKVEKAAYYMEKRMQKNLTTIIIIITLLAVALGTTEWAVSAFYQPFAPLHTPPPPPNNPGDFEFFYVAKTAISSINIALLSFILVSNVYIFRKTQSKFTFGLLIFSVAFLLKDLTASPIVIWAFGYRIEGLGPFAFLPDLFEFVVLTVLLYLSLE